MPDYTAHYAETERRLRELLAETADKLPARTMAEPGLSWRQRNTGWPWRRSQRA